MTDYYLLYICVIATVGFILKAYQLFGIPKK